MEIRSFLFVILIFVCVMFLLYAVRKNKFIKNKTNIAILLIIVIILIIFSIYLYFYYYNNVYLNYYINNENEYNLIIKIINKKNIYILFIKNDEDKQYKLPTINIKKNNDKKNVIGNKLKDDILKNYKEKFKIKDLDIKELDNNNIICTIKNIKIKKQKNKYYIEKNTLKKTSSQLKELDNKDFNILKNIDKKTPLFN